MKNGKKLTFEMKKLLTKNGYDANDYLYVKNQEEIITFVKKDTKEIVVVRKEN